MRGTVATLPLVPAVVDAVSPTPVVAAGGIADGRGLAAVLALGALGAWIGTRFLASEEATIHPRYRERLLEADENDTTYFEELFDVRWPKAPHRTLRNKTVELWESAGRPQSGRRPGEGEVIARSPTSGDIVRYQSYTPGPMPKEISTRCRSGRAKASVSSRRFSPRPRSFARSSTKQGRSSTGLQFSGSAEGQSCVRTTSRRFEFPSLRQRVVVSPGDIYPHDSKGRTSRPSRRRTATMPPHNQPGLSEKARSRCRYSSEASRSAGLRASVTPRAAPN